MIKKAILALSLAFLGAFPALADQVTSTSFKGLNSNENSVVIDPSEAQELLNVNVTVGGKSVQKRDGYGLYKALASSQPMRGGYHAFDSSGNDYQLWGSSTNLYGIVSDGTPTVLVSSATLGSTWDCADTQGNSYCVNSNRDAYIKANGTTMEWYTAPLGTMVESTPDRVVVAGVAAAPNTLYVSQSNTFTNYTTGVNATDAFTEVIASPGSHLTHIRWGCGKLLWWKDASFGYFDFDDQYTAQVKTVSDTIGTFDNTSAIDPSGQVWFRGQDGHTWKYDCSSLEKESIDITPNIQSSGKRVTNLWQQTSQFDWESGVVSSTNSLSKTSDLSIANNHLIDSSSTFASNSEFNGTVIYNGQVVLSTANTNILNNSFETGTLPGADNWTMASGFVTNSLYYGDNCSFVPYDGTDYLLYEGDASSEDIRIEVVDCSDSSVLENTAFTFAANSCSMSRTVSYNQTSNARKTTKIRIKSYKTGNIVATSDCFLNSGYPSSIRYGTDNLHDGYSNLHQTFSFDYLLNGRNQYTSGSYLHIFDSVSPHSYAGIQSSTMAGVTFLRLASADTYYGSYNTFAYSTGTYSLASRYILYVATLTYSGIGSSPSIAGVTFLSVPSTGTYYSPVKNVSNLTAWSTFGANQQLNGGTQTFYVRSSTNSFDILSATPSWITQPVGGLVAASTGTYFQVRDDFSVTATTQSNTLNDFTVDWYEGVATDQAYMLYFDNAIWKSVAFGSGQSTNNYIFKYDLINDGWTLYNIGTGGMLNQGNKLYFGDPLSGNVFSYGGSTSDNGSEINAYWRSKTFTGNDPFLQNQLNNIDVFAKKDAGTTLTATYTTDTSTATSYSISLSTSSSIVQSRKLLPNGKLGYTVDLKLGDNSASSAWEILGYRLGWNQLPYRPTP